MGSASGQGPVSIPTQERRPGRRKRLRREEGLDGSGGGPLEEGEQGRGLSPPEVPPAAGLVAARLLQRGLPRAALCPPSDGRRGSRHRPCLRGTVQPASHDPQAPKAALPAAALKQRLHALATPAGLPGLRLEATKRSGSEPLTRPQSPLQLHTGPSREPPVAADPLRFPHGPAGGTASPSESREGGSPSPSKRIGSR